MLIGIVGFAGSGKGTVGNIIKDKYGFQTDSFAAPLKDITSILFGWERSLLEGDTAESRHWRENPDRYWSKALDKKNFSPRKALQLVGTEAIRETFHEDFWVLSFHKRWNDGGKPNIVLTDCRFPNEIKCVQSLGGIIIQVQRGKNPPWYNDLLFQSMGHTDSEDEKRINTLRTTGTIPHVSETAWIGTTANYKIINDGTIDDLNDNVDYIMEKILK